MLPCYKSDATLGHKAWQESQNSLQLQLTVPVRLPRQPLPSLVTLTEFGRFPAPALHIVTCAVRSKNRMPGLAAVSFRQA